ncbi:MAG: surA 2 [Gammaproteobacteria bacterium]|jgi:peptidyl-prolyl cis-trans isomerase D|nr:surA 2 [Gammaproteobacteria bacterium]
MLQSIRDRSQGWLTWFLVITICISFALWGIHSYFEGASTPQIVASVNGNAITKQQLQSTYEHLRQQQQAENASNFPIVTEQQLKREALAQIIQTKVLSQAALDGGYRVSQAQLNAIVAQIPAFKVNDKFSPERFTEILSRMGYNPDSFFQDLQADLLQNQVQLGFVYSAFALPNEVQQVQALLNQRRDIAYTVIAASQFKEKVKLTDEQLINYYNQHQTSEFRMPEQVSINYIELELNKIAAEQKITEQEIRQYYQDNLANVTEPARYHLAHILIRLPKAATEQQLAEVQQKLAKLNAQLKTNPNFSELVKTYSDDVVSAKQEGDLGWLHLVDLEPAVAKLAAKLTKPGMITEPVQTQYGYEVIKLLAIEPEKVKSFAQVKANIKQRLEQQKAQQLFTELSDKLADLSFSNPDSLDTSAKQLGLTIQQTSLFTREGGNTSLTRNPKIIAAAFNKDVLEGSNSDLIEVVPGHVIVLRVNHFKPATPVPFANAKSAIKTKLQKQAMQNLAKQDSEQIIAGLKAGKTQEELAKKYSFKWTEATNLTRHSESPEMILVKTSFNMTQPANKAQTASQAVQLPSGDFAVIVLKKVTNLPPKKLPAQANEAFAKQMAISYGQVAYQLYIEHLMKQAKIKRTDSVSDN